MIIDVKPLPDTGRRLALERVKAGLTQRQLARESGADQSTIVKVERGNLNVRPMTIAKLAKALDIPVEELLGE